MNDIAFWMEFCIFLSAKKKCLCYHCQHCILFYKAELRIEAKYGNACYIAIGRLTQEDCQKFKVNLGYRDTTMSKSDTTQQDLFSEKRKKFIIESVE